MNSNLYSNAECKIEDNLLTIYYITLSIKPAGSFFYFTV